MSAGSSSSIAAAAEEDAGHEARIDAVVAAPGFDVVLKHGARDDARGRVPGVPIARVVADEEVRRVVEVRAGVEARRVEHLGDADVTVVWILQSARAGR